MMAYLRHVGLLVDGHKDFVEERLKVIALDAVHHEAFQRGHCGDADQGETLTRRVDASPSPPGSSELPAYPSFRRPTQSDL